MAVGEGKLTIRGLIVHPASRISAHLPLPACYPLPFLLHTVFDHTVSHPAEINITSKLQSIETIRVRG